jgi:hypothetical protein
MNGNGICKIRFYVIIPAIMLSAIRVFSNTGTYAFRGQGKNSPQKDVISNVFVTQERRVCFTLNMKF